MSKSRETVVVMRSNAHGLYDTYTYFRDPGTGQRRLANYRIGITSGDIRALRDEGHKIELRGEKW
jgi:hypothetical protein